MSPQNHQPVEMSAVTDIAYYFLHHRCCRLGIPSLEVLVGHENYGFPVIKTSDINGRVFGAPAYIILGQAIHCAGFTDSTKITLVTSYEMLGCFIGTRLMFQILIDLSSPIPHMCPGQSHYMRNGHPTFNREPLCCVYKPLLFGLMTIPYHGEAMAV